MQSGLFDQKSTFARTLGAVKSATNTIKTSTQQAAAYAIPQVKFKFISKDKDKFEKRILEELNKIFTGLFICWILELKKQKKNY